MTKERLAQLLEVSGPIAPEGIESVIGDLTAEGGEMISREAIAFQLDWNHVPEQMQKPLFEALETVNGIPELVELAGHRVKALLELAPLGVGKAV